MGGPQNPQKKYGSKANAYGAGYNRGPRPTTIDTVTAAPDAYSRIRWPDALRIQELIKTEWIDLVGFSVPRDWAGMTQSVKEVASIVRNWITSYRDNFSPVGNQGFQVFKQDWRYFRLSIPLQMRLIVEQVLYDLGYPWRSLCSGFGPIS